MAGKTLLAACDIRRFLASRNNCLKAVLVDITLPVIVEFAEAAELELKNMLEWTRGRDKVNCAFAKVSNYFLAHEETALRLKDTFEQAKDNLISGLSNLVDRHITSVATSLKDA